MGIPLIVYLHKYTTFLTILQWFYQKLPFILKKNLYNYKFMYKQLRFFVYFVKKNALAKCDEGKSKEEKVTTTTILLR